MDEVRIGTLVLGGVGAAAVVALLWRGSGGLAPRTAAEPRDPPAAVAPGTPANEGAAPSSASAPSDGSRREPGARREAAASPAAEPPEGLLPIRFVAAGVEVPGPDTRLRLRAFVAEPARVLEGSIVFERAPARWLPRTVLDAWLAAADGAPSLFAGMVFDRPGRERLGFVSEPLEPGVSELVLHEVRGARVSLRPRPVRRAPCSLSVTGQLVEARGEAVQRLSLLAPSGALELHYGRVEVGLAMDSAPIDDVFAPGRWRFAFRVGDSPLARIEEIEVELVEGDQVVDLALPDLFDVTVHAPSLGEGERLRLQAVRATPRDTATTTEEARDSEMLGRDHRAVFRALPAGQYLLSHGASFGSVSVVVPCGEVLYEPRRADAFEVRLAPLEDGSQGAFARAGLRTGDVLLAFNGRGVYEHEDLEAFLEVIAEAAASVRLRRGAHELELPLGPMPDPADPWATFDADFVPAWR